MAKTGAVFRSWIFGLGSEGSRIDSEQMEEDGRSAKRRRVLRLRNTFSSLGPWPSKFGLVETIINCHSYG